MTPGDTLPPVHCVVYLIISREDPVYIVRIISKRLASAALTRPPRSTVEATVAAIDADRRCNQSSAFEPRIAAAAATEASAPIPFTCTRGHFLVPAPVRGGAHSFQPRCNGPCGLLIWPGALRWMCEGHGCDIDICLDCVGGVGQGGEPRARIRCPLGHSMQFRLTSAPSHLVRRCDGMCRKPLCAGAWAYGCEPCQLDLCAACSPEGVSPAAAPPLGRVGAKRGRVQAAKVRLRPAGKRGGEPQRGRRVKHRRSLFDSDDDSEEGDDPRVPRTPHLPAGEQAAVSCERTGGGARTGRDATIPLAKCPVRPMGRDRGANAAGRHLYVRAGRGCELVSTACCRSLPRFTPPGTPAPLVFVSVCVSVLSAPSTVCLHGTGGCASCRDGK